MESSDAETKGPPPPEPPKPKRPFSVSQIERAHMPSSVRTTVPSRAQSQSLAKLLATPTAHQPLSKVNAKSKILPTPLDTPDLEAGPSRKAKQTAVVNSSNDVPNQRMLTKHCTILHGVDWVIGLGVWLLIILAAPWKLELLSLPRGIIITR
ncbi:hypothetical protein FRC11_002278 [Ceratobasidium sp. 423]|nr:hypothetical protein FRC11_002278 [Ceratobasidium sp. 423]